MLLNRNITLCTERESTNDTGHKERSYNNTEHREIEMTLNTGREEK